MAVRTIVALVALLVSFALPAAALAQGAGDEQYQDPFGDEQSQPEPTATPEPAQPPAAQPPPPSGEVAPAAPAQAPAPAAASGRQLPYTGADAGLLALAGALLLGAGVALRVRLRANGER